MQLNLRLLSELMIWDNLVERIVQTERKST